jgi:hypothetical protein
MRRDGRVYGILAADELNRYNQGTYLALQGSRQAGRKLLVGGGAYGSGSHLGSGGEGRGRGEE